MALTLVQQHRAGAMRASSSSTCAACSGAAARIRVQHQRPCVLRAATGAASGAGGAGSQQQKPADSAKAAPPKANVDTKTAATGAEKPKKGAWTPPVINNHPLVPPTELTPQRLMEDVLANRDQ